MEGFVVYTSTLHFVGLRLISCQLLSASDQLLSSTDKLLSTSDQLLSSTVKLLSASDINIVDRRPFSADCQQFPKNFLAVYEIPDLRITNERLDTFMLASEDICHSLLRKNLKYYVSYVRRTYKSIK